MSDAISKLDHAQLFKLAEIIPDTPVGIAVVLVLAGSICHRHQLGFRERLFLKSTDDPALALGEIRAGGGFHGPEYAVLPWCQLLQLVSDPLRAIPSGFGEGQ